MNSLYRSLNNYSLNPIQNMISALKCASDPQQYLMQLATKNPTIAGVLKEVEENGGDAKALFFKKAQQMGIDPNSILSQLK